MFYSVVFLRFLIEYPKLFFCIAGLYSNDKIFKESILTYHKTLTNVGYNQKLKKQEQDQEKDNL